MFVARRLCMCICDNEEIGEIQSRDLPAFCGHCKICSSPSSAYLPGPDDEPNCQCSSIHLSWPCKYIYINLEVRYQSINFFLKTEGLPYKIVPSNTKVGALSLLDISHEI